MSNLIKLGFFTIAIFFSLNSFTSDSDLNGVQLAKETLSLQSCNIPGCINHGELPSMCKEYLQKRANNIEYRLQEEVRKKLGGDLQYVCKSINFSFKSVTYSKSHFLSMDQEWWKYDRYLNAEVSANCLPRKLSEKQLYSMMKNCEQQPTAECYKPEFLKQLDTIGPTQFVYEGLEKACDI